jgi:acetyltransferase-like isoleucine patch superfamily enzyme
VTIEDNVWIGDKATILPNVHIGKGAIIAANAVVTHDVPAYAVAAGNPARIIQKK